MTISIELKILVRTRAGSALTLRLRGRTGTTALAYATIPIVLATADQILAMLQISPFLEPITVQICDWIVPGVYPVMP